MKHPVMMRDAVLARVTDMLEGLRVRVSCYMPDEIEVLRVIERPQQYEVATDLANYLMTRLGCETNPKEPRFNKVRRQLAKKRGRPPKGLTAEERANYYRETASAET